jgi:hypothetical protein
MTDAELVDLAVKMREAQRKYFANRSTGNLHAAKELELAFDRAVRGRTQGSLI